MSLFIPGHHQEIHARVVSFDVASQKGTVQFIGLYGYNSDGSVKLEPVESDPYHLMNPEVYSVGRKLEYLEPSAVYLPDEWVIVRGVPSGPTGLETPNRTRGLTPVPYSQKYYIIGKLKHQPPRERLDHDYASKMYGGPTKFPPIEYTPLPHEDPSSGTV